MTEAGTAGSRRSGASEGDGPVPTVFFGSGAFAVPILEAILEAPEVRLVAVVAVPDRPAGRRAEPSATPVAARARTLGLALLQPPSIRTEAGVAALAALGADLGILADYGRIVPPEVLALPRYGILNVHPSILPRHRGAAPIAATILAGDVEAGVSLMAMDAGLDTGPIVASTRWPLEGHEAAPELEARAAAAGAVLVRTSLAGWLAGTLPARPQDEAAATLTRPLRRSDGRLDPGRPARVLERTVRAYRPWPGTFVETDAGRLAILAGEVGPGHPGDVPGRLVADGDGLALTTVEGRLRLLEVQPAGGRAMSAPEFRRGRGRDLVGAKVASGD